MYTFKDHENGRPWGKSLQSKKKTIGIVGLHKFYIWHMKETEIMLLDVII